MVRYVPTEVQRLLDVGCATGSFADALCRERIGVEVWGIDPIPLPPGHEDASLRRRIVGHFPEDLPAAERFDCVVFNDVLEHMVDPWGALAAAGDILGGPRVVVASIPNVRNAAAVIQPLVLRGRWDYSDYGILDHTHLRFFTRSTIIEMFEKSGYAVLRIEPLRVPVRGRRALVNRVTGGRFTEFLAQRFAVLGKLR